VPLSLPTNAEDRVLPRSGEPRHFREGSDLARQRCSLVGPDGHAPDLAWLCHQLRPRISIIKYLSF
jgi:hypothetical protein